MNSQTNRRWLQAMLLLLSTLVATAQGQVIELGSAQEFNDLITAGELDLILDVRTAREWAGGHIQDATFVDSLHTQLSNSNDDEALLRSLNIWNCRHCRVAVYCGSGVRAGNAADRLLEAGFEGKLYNALGVGQWTNAGYPLVNDPSKEDWPCMMADDAVISRQGGGGVCPVGDDKSAVIDLTSEEFNTMMTSGQLDLVIDTRTAAEWDMGHIENATFIDSLQVQLSETTNYESVLRQVNLWGCRTCRVAVYCRSGRRSGEALNLLSQAGFEGQLYNGQGVNQWTEAGYPLVTGPSKDDWPCMMSDDAVCALSEDLGDMDLVGPYDMHQMELDSARDLFMAQMEKHNATAYSFNYTRSCFCPPADYPWRITAEIQQLMIGVKPNFTDDVSPMMIVNPVHVANSVGDVVTSAITSKGANVVASQANTFSILDLFDKIQDAIDKEAADIQVVYHKDWGHPEDIAIDYKLQIADEEWYSTATDFDILSIAPSMMENEEQGEEVQVQAAIGVDEGMAAEPPAQWAKNFGW